MTLAAVTILLIVLAASDDRVREQMTNRAGIGGRSGQVGSVVARARTTADMVGGVVRNETRTHTVLVAFTIAGAVLVVFMLRT